MQHGNIKEHIDNMTTTFDRFEIREEKLSKKWIVAIILGSLPSSYRTLLMVKEALPQKDITLYLKTTPLEEYQRR